MGLPMGIVKAINNFNGQDYDRLIIAIAKATTGWDALVGEHSLRTAGYALMIGKEAGLPEIDMNYLYIASLLHDAGKLIIPINLLNKPDVLDEEEWSLIKKHPQYGAEMVNKLQPISHLAPVILHHHEFFNGRGYPGEIAGADIPLMSRIITVADAYEAMTTDRPFRRGFSHRDAVSRLKHGKRTQFDPDIVEYFLKGIRMRSTIHISM